MHYFGEFGTPYPYVRISSHKDCATGATVCKQSDTPHLHTDAPLAQFVPNRVAIWCGPSSARRRHKALRNL